MFAGARDEPKALGVELDNFVMQLAAGPYNLQLKPEQNIFVN
jgi:hypothetical protein